MLCGMFDATIIKDLTELMAKNITFKDMEAIGGYLFKDRAYNLHTAAGIAEKVSISPLNAAKILIEQAVEGTLRLRHRARRVDDERPYGGSPGD